MRRVAASGCGYSASPTQWANWNTTVSTTVDVGVLAVHVRVGVVEHDVLPPPQVGGRADQVEGQRREAVHPRVPRVRVVAAVVLDAEADGGDGQRQRDGERGGQPHRR